VKSGRTIFKAETPAPAVYQELLLPFDGQLAALNQACGEHWRDPWLTDSNTEIHGKQISLPQEETEAD
jgi:hypothetical protein